MLTIPLFSLKTANFPILSQGFWHLHRNTSRLCFPLDISGTLPLVFSPLASLTGYSALLYSHFPSLPRPHLCNWKHFFPWSLLDKPAQPDVSLLLSAPLSPRSSIKAAMPPFYVTCQQSGSVLVQVDPILCVWAQLVPKMPNKSIALLSTPSFHPHIKTPQLCLSSWLACGTGSILEKPTLMLLAFSLLPRILNLASRTSQLHFVTSLVPTCTRTIDYPQHYLLSCLNDGWCLQGIHHVVHTALGDCGTSQSTKWE